MNGVGGLAGWRWLLLCEGLPAGALGLYTLYALPVVFAAGAPLMAWDFLLKLRPLLPAVLERTFPAKLVPQQSAVLIRPA